MNWYIKALKQYTRFHGRARRKEFWYFNLINFLIYFLLSLPPIIVAQLYLQHPSDFVFAMFFASLPFYIYNAGVLLPSVAVTIRRLHDTGKSGWWCVVLLIPILGGLILLCFMLQESEPGQNRFGRNPKESSIS